MRNSVERTFAPQHFKGKDPTEILQTLVHEMCHLWQCHFGKPSRGGYHNKEWANQMIAIGLMPSDTSREGGKNTEQRMGDYPIPNGPFLNTTAELLATGFAIIWYDRARPKTKQPAVIVADGDTGQDGEVKTPSGTRRKFTYPGCQAHAYGKGGLKLICAECMEPMA